MRLIVLAAGKLKAGPERALVDDYLARAEAAGRGVGLAPVEEIAVETKAKAKAKDDETAALLAALPEDAVLIALDERGKGLTSEDLARRVEKWRDQGRRAVALVIGGADGLGPEARRRADLVVAFGPQTWPHRLVRAMAAEQLYRVVTILTNSPYHRG